MIGLINGLYGTEYPLDSKITYNWTEFVDEDEKLRKMIAGTIITINERFSYHLEAQAYYDNEAARDISGVNQQETYGDTDTISSSKVKVLDQG